MNLCFSKTIENTEVNKTVIVLHIIYIPSKYYAKNAREEAPGYPDHQRTNELSQDNGGILCIVIYI